MDVTSSEPATSVPPGRQAHREQAIAALLEGLNPAQRQAVTHEGSPLLVVAGAGSGKTRVLTARIAYLLLARDVHPGSIMAITFTNKAAGEMKQRIAALVGPRVKPMWVSTFHSACVRILRKEAENVGLRNSFSIYDTDDSRRLMGQVLGQLEVDPRQFTPRAVCAVVSNAKNELVDEESFAATAHTPAEQIYAQCYTAYMRRLREANALDFDDLIMTTVNILQAFPQVAQQYQRRFRHILVDEYQDTNHAQYVLVRLLAGAAEPAARAGAAKARQVLREALTSLASNAAGSSVAGAAEQPAAPAELVVVGDADQSIYAFRGATIRNIVAFEQDFPNASTIVLEQNYRSTQTILSAANAVIARNPDRRPKNLWSDKGNGEPIIGYVADNENEEAQFVATEIARLCAEHGYSRRDFAIFYRTNAASRVYEEIFLRTGVPYRVIGGVRFYERREVRDALAYLRVLVNPSDGVSMRRIINTPKRGIGDKAIEHVQAWADRQHISFAEALEQAAQITALAARSAKAIADFVALLEEMRELAETSPVAVVAEQVIQRSGYLDSLMVAQDLQDESRRDNLAELVAVAAEFAAANPEATLADFLGTVALVADTDSLPDQHSTDQHSTDQAQEGAEPPDEGQVTLMTLHSAKGLEFPVVFLTGMEEGVFPHLRALENPTEQQEERRLAYVGITRAQQRLYVSRAQMRTTWGAPRFNPASRFLLEIGEQHLRWRREDSTVSAGAGRESLWGQRLSSGTSGTRGDRAWGGAASGDVQFWREQASDLSRPAQPSTSARGVVADAVLDLSVGDRVSHDTYGLGTVVSTAGSGRQASATIDFGTAGQKRLLLRYAPVEKL